MSSSASAIRVLVVDDHPVVREGLKMLFNGAPDLRVVGEARDVSEALHAARTLEPHVVLVDLDLGGEDGMVLVRQLGAAAPSSRALVLTAFRDREHQEAALLAGARGLIQKDRPPELLLKAIRKVHQGELWFDRALLEAALTRAIAGAPAVPPQESERIASLTAREREIVALIGEGLRNEDIGKRLAISEKTVRNHLSAVFEKLRVTDRLELVVYAYQHGLARSRR